MCMALSACRAGQWTLVSRRKNERRPTITLSMRVRCIDIVGLYLHHLAVWYSSSERYSWNISKRLLFLTFRNAFSASSLFPFHLSRKAALRGVKLDSTVIEYQRSHMMWEQVYCNVLVVGSGISAPKKGSASCSFTARHPASTHHSPNHPTVLGRQFHLSSSESGSSG